MLARPPVEVCTVASTTRAPPPPGKLTSASPPEALNELALLLIACDIRPAMAPIGVLLVALSALVKLAIIDGARLALVAL